MKPWQRALLNEQPKGPKTVEDKNRTENDSLIDAVKEFVEPRALQLTRGAEDAAQVLITPKGFDVRSVKPLLDEYLPKPERRRGTTVLTDPTSLIAFVNRTKNADSAIYVDDVSREPSITAVIDHDARGEDGTETARWGQHRAFHRIELSDEWKAWTKVDNTALTQRDFAEIIEDRALDLIDPAAVEAVPATDTTPAVARNAVLDLADKLGLTLATTAEVIEASRGLKLRAEVNVGETITLSSGETEIHYSEAHKGADGAALKVPSAFLIAVPVLKGAFRDVLLVRLRYRRASGQPRVSWCVVLHHPDEVQKHAVAELVERVRTETGLDVFRGAFPK